MLVHLSSKERLGYAAIFCLLLFAFGYAGAQHLRKPATIVFKDKARNAVAQLEQEPNSENEPTEIVIHVTGAVSKPGVYTFDTGSRVMDAVERAGGSTKEADLEALNLAAELLDGSQLKVPVKEAPKPVAEPKKTTSPEPARRDNSVPPLKIQVVPEEHHPSYSPPTESPYAQQRGLGESDKEAPKQPVEDKPKYEPKVIGVVNINTADEKELQKLPGVGPATAAKILEYRYKYGRFLSVEELLAINGIGAKTLEKMRPYVRL